MNRILSLLLGLCLLPGILPAQNLEPIKPIERRLPPAGIEIPDDVRQQLLGRLSELKQAYEKLKFHPDNPDAGVLIKGVDFALTNGEFYNEKDFATANRHLDLAAERIEALAKQSAAGERSIDWGSGLTVHGYESEIDDSLQPYGLEIPEKLDRSKPAPLLVWLHGRGDKTTDLHFIEGCLTRSRAMGGKIAEQEEFIVLHAFGRQCIGWKHAGELDVFDAIRAVGVDFEIDSDRVVLAGFSMGGAGAWHVGAHYADHFAAVHAGAGFAETKLYNKLKPEDFPPKYEQALWGLYDVPGYARNLLNLPVVAYSGEVDKQKQATDVMEAALAEHGLELTHFIGPGMGHKYHDDVIPPIFDILRQAKSARLPDQVEIQTRTLRYGSVHWVGITGMEEHWREARVSASRTDQLAEITTENVTGLMVGARLDDGGSKLIVDGQTLEWGEQTKEVFLRKTDGKWGFEEDPWRSGGLQKLPRLQGPIDDAFMASFLLVKPSAKSKNALLQRWLDFEIAHFENRWRELMRGELRVKTANQITEDDRSRYNLICFGDPDTNPVIAAALPELPIEWNSEQLLVAGKSYDSTNHLPALIFPNPDQNRRYIVLNSGLTFREGHDRTNSLQNPKLPDWAVIDIRQDPDNLTAGKIVAADFFDEAWQFKSSH
ncbi:MAG: pimeloyl-ACP methyl ester carboxylesterase [Verrucomicrobiales bacterium]|jgi:pimeloyl-ACP methyl ester carboxylesterase